MKGLHFFLFWGLICPTISYRSQPLLKTCMSRLQYQKKSNDLVETELQLIVDPVSNNDVNKMLEEMSLPDKYYLLLQSYGSKIMESSKRDSALFDKMDSLFDSMLQKSIAPDDRSAQYLLDSAALFGRVEVMTRALRLTKAGEHGSLVFLCRSFLYMYMHHFIIMYRRTQQSFWCYQRTAY